MVKWILKWLHKRLPQNYIIKDPLIGMLIFLGLFRLYSAANHFRSGKDRGKIDRSKEEIGFASATI
jgi:hypothetical protein